MEKKEVGEIKADSRDRQGRLHGGHFSTLT